jgi:hypothetical protein
VFSIGLAAASVRSRRAASCSTATVTGFAEGEASKYSDKYVGGKSLMGVGHLLRPVHTPQHYTAPLYLCSHRHRLRSEGDAAQPDARRSDREVRATADASEGRGGSRWTIRQSVAQLMQHLLFAD